MPNSYTKRSAFRNRRPRRPTVLFHFECARVRQVHALLSVYPLRGRALVGATQ